MAHEKLQKQYEEDCKNYKRPWELWEFKSSRWHTCMYSPQFASECEYRRKEPPFEPEYFSGLNWPKAEKLVGRKIEVSNDGDKWAGPFMLKGVSIYPVISRFELQSGRWTYIRTCPETYAHPTITISGVELPSPEIESPRCGCMVWVFTPFHPDGYYETTYQGYCGEEIALKRGFVHLTEDRAQAWADWWENTVIKAMKGE